MQRVAFIGHRLILRKSIIKRLVTAVESEIENGCKMFTMGTHGDFDIYALSVCRRLRDTYPDLKIEVVITSLKSIKREGKYHFRQYADVKTVMYDIENVHYKQQITLSNKKMIDTCDTLICYVNEDLEQSGAKTALNYAKRKGLKIINLYEKSK